MTQFDEYDTIILRLSDNEHVSILYKHINEIDHIKTLINNKINDIIPFTHNGIIQQNMYVIDINNEIYHGLNNHIFRIIYKFVKTQKLPNEISTTDAATVFYFLWFFAININDQTFKDNKDLLIEIFRTSTNIDLLIHIKDTVLTDINLYEEYELFKQNGRQHIFQQLYIVKKVNSYTNQFYKFIFDTEWNFENVYSSQTSCIIFNVYNQVKTRSRDVYRFETDEHNYITLKYSHHKYNDCFDETSLPNLLKTMILYITVKDIRKVKSIEVLFHKYSDNSLENDIVERRLYSYSGSGKESIKYNSKKRKYKVKYPIHIMVDEIKFVTFIVSHE